MTVTDNDFLDLQDKYLALKKTVDILLTNLGDPSTMVPGTVNFGGNLFASPVGMVARRQKFQWPAEVITNQINGGSGAVPTGSPDMDLNNDGTVSILDASILAAKYTPPKGSGWVWVETPDNIIYPGSSPSPQSYVFGLTAYAPNAYMTESTSVRLGSTGTAGTAEIVPHSAKSTALSQADIRLRGAVWQTATTLTQISADTNDYEVGENICSVFRISSDAARNITGIVAPTTNTTFTPNVWWLILLNAGSFNITLKDSSGSSSAANRFALDADIVLKPDQGCFLMYDSASTVWRAIAYPSTAGGVATDAIWDAKGDLAVGTGADTAAALTVGTDGKRLAADSATATYGLGWKSFFFNMGNPNSGSFAVTSDMKFINAALTGNLTINLYSAATIGAGDVILIKRTDTTGYTCTIDGNSSQTIDGSLTITLGALESVMLVSDGGQWWVC